LAVLVFSCSDLYRAEALQYANRLPSLSQKIESPLRIWLAVCAHLLLNFALINMCLVVLVKLPGCNSIACHYAPGKDVISTLWDFFRSSII
jgi:hypothetical protein